MSVIGILDPQVVGPRATIPGPDRENCASLRDLELGAMTRWVTVWLPSGKGVRAVLQHVIMASPQSRPGCFLRDV